MTLTNYWWLLIWLAGAGVFLYITMPKQQVCIAGEICYRWNWISCLVLSLPYLGWAVTRSQFGDTETYRQIFYKVPNSILQIVGYLSSNSKDQGFSVFTCMLKMLIGDSDILFFFVIAAFQLFCVVWFFRKYSTSFALCFFMFIASTDYLSWMHNGIRQFIAVCAVLLCFDWIVKRKYVPVILVILLVSTIHASVLIMIPIIFVVQGKAWNRKTILMLIAVIVAVLFIDQFTTLLDELLAETQYSDLITNEIWTNDDGTNFFRVLFYSIPTILSLFGKKYIDAVDDPVINVCVNCSLVTTSIYLLANVSSGIYVGRIPIYTTLPGYVMCIWLIEKMFTKKSAQIVKFGLIVGYIAFFYYQMHFVWGLL